MIQDKRSWSMPEKYLVCAVYFTEKNNPAKKPKQTTPNEIERKMMPTVYSQTMSSINAENIVWLE